MEEVTYSWIRSTKFSHPFDSRLVWSDSRSASIPVSFQEELIPELKSRPVPAAPAPAPAVAPSTLKLSSSDSKIQRNNRMSSLSAKKEWAKKESPRAKKESPRAKEEWSKKESPRAKEESSKKESPRAKKESSKKESPRAKEESSKKESPRAKKGEHGGEKTDAVVDKFSVDLSKLLLGRKFAHGAHSKIYHGVYKEEAVAVKMIEVPEDKESGVLAATLEKQFNTEVNLLSRLHHPNVIKLVAACRKPPVDIVVTEYLDEGSLRVHLKKLEEGKSLPLKKLTAMALDIARGMEYIHSQGVIHRDLKPENVLIDKDFRLKIADFGIACEEKADRDSLTGTYRWMAPEMIKGNKHKPYGRKVDVYSFGLILWELVAGKIPFDEMSPLQAAFAVSEKNLRPPIPEDCPPAMGALIEQCWSLQPDRRPEFGQIVKELEDLDSTLLLLDPRS